MVDSWTQRNQNVDVGELIKGFFRFYAGETSEKWGGNRFDWQKGAISPLEGGIVRRLRREDESVKSVTGSGVGGLWIRKVDGKEEPCGLEWCMAEEKGKEGGKESVQLVKWNNAVMVVRDPFEWHKVSFTSLSPSLFISLACLIFSLEKRDEKQKTFDASLSFSTSPSSN